nr:MAG TPA: hypothetical protein [Caudoviricetes sp.]DAM73881.1 MAG TPA: hypothetical protein [Caudoviricetes sp.]
MYKTYFITSTSSSHASFAFTPSTSITFSTSLPPFGYSAIVS